LALPLPLPKSTKQMISFSSLAHSFHIPVMGLGFTVDTPIKVARFGISSVVSIMDDHLLEDMRRLYSRKLGLPYMFIDENRADFRAERIKAYLNLLHDVVANQLEAMKIQQFCTESELDTYFKLLPQHHPLSKQYAMLDSVAGETKAKIEHLLKSSLISGQIDVNIMTKVDKTNYTKAGEELPREYSDALSALRGFAQSKLSSSVVFSAGLNPALYSYVEQFADFYPDAEGKLKKKIILKVSDYRSALIQGKFFAKKGLWVSEFRIESGLNCGGHAFATDGFLIGPILEEFKQNRQELNHILYEACQQVLQQRQSYALPQDLQTKITYQGGIGTADENRFLTEFYQLDGTGWGSPFLLVPEATSVDEDTLQRLMNARKSDFYLSNASPLGVPFNNLRTSSGEEQRKARIAKDRPGSPCYKKFLSFSKEFTDKPICTASREFQYNKIKQLQNGETTPNEVEAILEKDCLCEGLSAPAILSLGETPRRNLSAVTICPGPNLAYFKGVFSLKEMVDHIYGRINLNLDPERPHVFVKELQLYMQHLKNEMEKTIPEKTAKYEAYLEKFKSNVNDGIQYYQNLMDDFAIDTEEVIENMKVQLTEIKHDLLKSMSLTM
jgi:hypothetical protein